MAWTVLRPFVLPQARELLKREIRKPRSHADWLDFTRGFHERLWAPRRLRKRFSIAPSQIRSEILGWLELVDALEPERLMEIGTSNGGVFFLMARAAAARARLIGVDLAAQDGGCGVPLWKVPLFESFASEGQEVEIVRGDSHDPDTLARVRRSLGGTLLDVLFIDGDHSYAGVARDFEMYAALVRPGGLIGFHDIVPDRMRRTGVPSRSDAGEVYRLWAELKQRDGATEIVEDSGQDGFGIGVIRVGDVLRAQRTDELQTAR